MRNILNHQRFSSKACFQLGAGLIEVMIVILLLGVGLVSMSRIQIVVLQEGGTANNRAVAMQLAQAKLDEFKAFKCPLFVAGSNCVSSNASDRDFLGIVSGSDAAVITSLGGVALNTSFTRSWTVVDYYLCGVGSTASTSNCVAPNTPKSYPDIKVIEITVSWSDAKANQSVVLNSAIQSSDSFSMADAFGGTGTVFGKPQVRYTPQSVPDSIAFDFGGGGSLKHPNPCLKFIVYPTRRLSPFPLPPTQPTVVFLLFRSRMNFKPSVARVSSQLVPDGPLLDLSGMTRPKGS